MGKQILKIFKFKDKASIGIGAMIVFIAMVLVAGIAASVLIQTSMKLESQALSTGQETTAEVSSGLDVVSIIGYQTSGTIDLLAINVRARAGSSDIDLGETIIEISDSTKKNILSFDIGCFTLADDIDGEIFNYSFYTSNASDFSILVLEDADGSCSSGSSAVINSGDYIILGINTSAAFGGFEERIDVWGTIIPEEGSPGVIYFTTPASYPNNVLELQ
jgi:flagellin FlaB